MNASSARHPLVEAIRAQLGADPSPFTLLVEFCITSGQEAAMHRVIAAAVAGTRREAGAVAYEVHQVLGEASRFVLFEKWRSLADLEGHFAQDYTRAALAWLEQAAAGPTLLRVLRPYEPAAISADGAAVRT